MQLELCKWSNISALLSLNLPFHAEDVFSTQMAAMERIMKFMHLEGAQEGLHSVAHIMFRLVHASGCLVVSKIFLSGGWKLLETPTRYQRKF